MLLDGEDIYGVGRRPGRRAQDHRHGVPAAEPVPHHVDSRQRGGRSEAAGRAQQEDARRGRRALAQGRQPLERGQGPAGQAGRRSVRRSAAASVHRARHRGAARRAADGRALFGAGPDLHAGDRGSDRGAQAGLHDRHRHAQHAAGRAGERPDGFFNLEATGKPGGSSRSTTPRRSSPTRARRRPRTTSPAASASADRTQVDTQKPPICSGAFRLEWTQRDGQFVLFGGGCRWPGR